MQKANTGDSVKVHYSGTLEDGTQFDSSLQRDPLDLTLGSGAMIPGFENAIEGMAVGEKKIVKITQENAYGPRNEQMVQEISKSELPDGLQATVGMQLQASGPEGQTVDLIVSSVTEETITVDGNHPLAGHSLNFEIELMCIN